MREIERGGEWEKVIYMQVMLIEIHPIWNTVIRVSYTKEKSMQDFYASPPNSLPRAPIPCTIINVGSSTFNPSLVVLRKKQTKQKQNTGVIC